MINTQRMSKKFKVSNILPLGVDIITTANKADRLPSGIIMPETSNTVNPIQEVLAVGPHEHSVSVGDIVEINPESFPYENVKAKHDVGADTKGKIILPIYTDDDKVEFLKIRAANVLWGIKGDE